MRERRKSGIDATLPLGRSEIRLRLEVAQNAIDELLLRERRGLAQKDLKPNCDETRKRSAIGQQNARESKHPGQKLVGDCQEADGELRYCAVN